MTAARRLRRVDDDVPQRQARGTAVLRTERIRVDRGGRNVLTDVDLTVDAGEVVALVGPNGAGKSSLLAALSGDLAVTSGGVELFGQPLHHWSTAAMARRRGVLPQRVTVSFPFTVSEVVAMGRAPWARTALRERDDELVARSIAEVDLSALSARSFTTLSGGEQARAALARVLAQDTQLLLLDEPTASLDLHHQELVFDTVSRHARRGGATVAVVHDLGLAAGHADRIVLLDRGRLAAIGTPEAVLTPETLGPVYRHQVDVITNPLDGTPMVLPHRRTRPL